VGARAAIANLTTASAATERVALLADAQRHGRRDDGCGGSRCTGTTTTGKSWSLPFEPARRQVLPRFPEPQRTAARNARQRSPFVSHSEGRFDASRQAGADK